MVSVALHLIVCYEGVQHKLTYFITQEEVPIVLSRFDDAWYLVDFWVEVQQ